VSSAQVVFEIAARCEHRRVGGRSVATKYLLRADNNVQHAADFAFDSGVHHGPFLGWFLA
jgi:hypothetical protein